MYGFIKFWGKKYKKRAKKGQNLSLPWAERMPKMREKWQKMGSWSRISIFF
jgi:hypothetical protein